MIDDLPHYAECLSQPDGFPCICVNISEKYAELQSDMEENEVTGN